MIDQQVSRMLSMTQFSFRVPTTNCPHLFDCLFEQGLILSIDSSDILLCLILVEQGLMKSKQLVPGKLTPCIFEYIYLSRPDSVLSDIAVYNFQLSLGRRLAKRIKETG